MPCVFLCKFVFLIGIKLMNLFWIIQWLSFWNFNFDFDRKCFERNQIRPVRRWPKFRKDDPLMTLSSHLHKKHGREERWSGSLEFALAGPLAIGHATCFASGRGESFLSLETSVPDSPGFNCKHELAGCVHSSLPRFTSLPGINNRAASLKQPPGTSGSFSFSFSFFFFSS